MERRCRWAQISSALRVRFSVANTPFTYKRLSYAHEREVRAMMLHFEIPDLVPPDTGMNVECDLSALIQGVYVSPESPSWFADVVRSVMTKYGLDMELTHSDLASDPV